MTKQEAAASGDPDLIEMIGKIERGELSASSGDPDDITLWTEDDKIRLHAALTKCFGWYLPPVEVTEMKEEIE